MPAAEMSRTVTKEIPSAPDRVIRVSVVSWVDKPELGTYIEINDYIPSRDLYGRGYMFPIEHSSQVATGVRAATKANS